MDHLILSDNLRLQLKITNYESLDYDDKIH